MQFVDVHKFACEYSTVYLALPVHRMARCVAPQAGDAECEVMVMEMD